jgi:hypothetical protein
MKKKRIRVMKWRADLMFCMTGRIYFRYEYRGKIGKIGKIGEFGEIEKD